ncbi:pollen-specific leucine-rich repeat extensin-like protein 4 [Iris pallida]|uniref:Pollen-specific leucine-rich repeat extensin-like protein 4 n=1 Tax=Iris pallida TaxID=29817 RepID=A0AAX6G8X6_IRIPA|nr:pollen-specific leucine-rich repeat extensin-like protein 4 [Iris pallida]KAJ6824661.1 pollen-specific leucine-rich repeat extensin-like protein 4 [Iris pallida]
MLVRGGGEVGRAALGETGSRRRWLLAREENGGAKEGKSGVTLSTPVLDEVSGALEASNVWASSAVGATGMKGRCGNVERSSTGTTSEKAPPTVPRSRWRSDPRAPKRSTRGVGRGLTASADQVAGCGRTRSTAYGLRRCGKHSHRGYRARGRWHGCGSGQNLRYSTDSALGWDDHWAGSGEPYDGFRQRRQGTSGRARGAVMVEVFTRVLARCSSVRWRRENIEIACSLLFTSVFIF